MPLSRDVLHRQRDGGERHIDDRIDAFGVVPLRCDGRADIALFWWSAKMTSIFFPATLPPASSAAMRAATTDPCPDRSAFMPVWSFSTPILTTPPEAIHRFERLAQRGSVVQVILLPAIGRKNLEYDCDHRTLLPVA